MEGFMILGLDLILPGWRWRYKLQTPGKGFHAVLGGIDRRTTVFISGLLES